MIVPSDLKNNTQCSLLFLPHGPLNPMNDKQKFVIKSVICRQDHKMKSNSITSLNLDGNKSMTSSFQGSVKIGPDQFRPPLSHITASNKEGTISPSKSCTTISLKTLKLHRGLKEKRSIVRTKKKRHIMRKKPYQN